MLLANAALAEVNCSRSELTAAVNAYLAAQTAGDRQLLPAAPQTMYYQQHELVGADDSIVNQVLAIDFHRSILDEYSCQSFTELVVLDEAHPYAIGTRLRAASAA
jgi:hypothetical protein